MWQLDLDVGYNNDRSKRKRILDKNEESRNGHILKMRTREDALSEGKKKTTQRRGEETEEGKKNKTEAGEEKEDDDGDRERKERKDDEENNIAKRIQERTRKERIRNGSQ